MTAEEITLVLEDIASLAFVLKRVVLMSAPVGKKCASVPAMISHSVPPSGLLRGWDVCWLLSSVLDKHEQKTRR